METRKIWKPENYVLLMNRFIYIFSLAILFPVQFIFAQGIPGLNFTSYSNNYLGVYSYNGAVSYEAFTFRVTHSGTGINIPNWKLSARVTQPIVSQDGSSIFPAEMLSFQPIYTTGSNPSGSIPTVSQIGMPLSVSLNGLNETFLIPQSQAPINYTSQYNSFYDLNMKYNFTVAPGSYLQFLQGGYNQKRYQVSLEFRLYSNTNQILGVINRSYTIDVFKLGEAPNDFIIQISGEATNALLEIQSPGDYANGAHVVYPSGLSVQSNVGYQLKVRSINPEFSSAIGNTIPLNTVTLQLIPNSGNNATVYPISLSSSAQTIATGNATGNTPAYFDIKYSTPPNNQNLIQVPSDTYGTTLEYQLTPQ